MNRYSYLNKLKELRPENFQLNNYDLLPDQFKPNDLLDIDCNKHGRFLQKAHNHLYGHNCPKCGREKTEAGRTLTTDEFIKRSIDKFGNRFNYEKTTYIKKGIDLTITCSVHGDFNIRPEAHLWLPEGCPECNRVIPQHRKKDNLIRKAKILHKDKYDYSKVNYQKFNDTVEIICPKHGVFLQKFHSHAHNGIGCPKCARENDKLTTNHFISRAKQIHGNRYNYDKVIYENNQSSVIITCEKHGDFVQRAGSHLAGNKCRECSIEDSKNTIENFIKQAKEIHSNKYDYSKAVYLGNKKPIEIICPIHGSFWKKPNSHLSSKSGCTKCRESKGETSISTFLNKYKITFIQEYKIPFYNYRYDFFLPEFNIFIEFHGQQHYKPVDFFGGENEFLKTIKNDLAKKSLVKDRQGHLIVLNYLTLSENAIEKNLIFSLKKIYPYWFVIDEKIQVFKKSLDVYIKFNINMSVLVNNVVNEIKKKYKNFQVLF